ESLYKTIDRQKEDTKIIYGLSTDNKLEEKHWQELLKSIDRAKKILVLCGQLPPDFLLNDSLVQLCNDPRICVLTESHSNLVHDYFIGTIDRLIIGFDEEQIAFFRPDILITLGNNIISRKIKAYLREGNAEHWHIDAAAEPLDTFQRLKKIVPLSPRQFIVEWVQRHKPQSGNYATLLSAMHLQNRNSATSFIESTRFCDLSAMATIVSFLPDGSCLQMANSAVVRYIQLFDPRADIRYFANRGVSGIDGCTSTAAGAAYASGQLTTLITGDIAFLYDSNAFWNNYISDHLKIIVLNNAGGGIFRIIEGPSSSEAMEEFFETHHNRTAEALAAMYGIPYLSAADSNELSKGLSALYHSKGCMVLEVHTPRLENDKVLKDCFKMIKNNQLQLRNESLQLDKH
ncbi:MAG: 2-succinyl-5-enolpyruvyl-6-hydroxy-3-cyclohexene-1-carboxylate synthase, partial [Crocinitomicaceae bacterium]|nr:2-succinyl-5-enolpyruvyl-6-hydroxy-3-cyclohexene-1-carboxylate synthase [Crocinitomicaceae bacterium]